MTNKQLHEIASSTPSNGPEINWDITREPICMSRADTQPVPPITNVLPLGKAVDEAFSRLADSLSALAENRGDPAQPPGDYLTQALMAGFIRAVEAGGIDLTDYVLFNPFGMPSDIDTFERAVNKAFSDRKSSAAGVGIAVSSGTTASES